MSSSNILRAGVLSQRLHLTCRISMRGADYYQPTVFFSQPSFCKPSPCVTTDSNTPNACVMFLANSSLKTKLSVYKEVACPLSPPSSMLAHVRCFNSSTRYQQSTILNRLAMPSSWWPGNLCLLVSNTSIWSFVRL